METENIIDISESEDDDEGEEEEEMNEDEELRRALEASNQMNLANQANNPLPDVIPLATPVETPTGGNNVTIPLTNPTTNLPEPNLAPGISTATNAIPQNSNSNLNNPPDNGIHVSLSNSEVTPLNANANPVEIVNQAEAIIDRPEDNLATDMNNSDLFTAPQPNIPNPLNVQSADKEIEENK